MFTIDQPVILLGHECDIGSQCIASFRRYEKFGVEVFTCKGTVHTTEDRLRAADHQLVPTGGTLPDGRPAYKIVWHAK